MGAIQRILQYLDFKGISKYKFYKMTNLSNGFLDKGFNIGSDKCEKISYAFPNLNLDWLITGNGPMEKMAIEGETNLGIISFTEAQIFERTQALEFILRSLVYQKVWLWEITYYLFDNDFKHPLFNLELPNKTQQWATDKHTHTRYLKKDEKPLTVFEIMSIDEKLNYLKELEYLRDQWSLEVENQVKDFNQAVKHGGKYFNKLVTGSEEEEPSLKRLENIKAKVIEFVQGEGLEDYKSKNKVDRSK